MSADDGEELDTSSQSNCTQQGPMLCFALDEGSDGEKQHSYYIGWDLLQNNFSRIF
jgi:hypothetical protein